MNDDVFDVTLADLPSEIYEQAVTYLADVLRECQLIGVDGVEGNVTSLLDVVALAEVLMPDLEVVRDMFRTAQVAENGGRITVVISLRRSVVATLVHLQMHLVQLRFVECEGGILVASDPAVIELLRWIWHEVSEQLDGRSPRTFLRT